MDKQITTCKYCGETIEKPGARFCSACGGQLASAAGVMATSPATTTAKLSMRILVILLVIAAIFWSSATLMYQSLAGTRPLQTYTPAAAIANSDSDNNAGHARPTALADVLPEHLLPLQTTAASGDSVALAEYAQALGTYYEQQSRNGSVPLPIVMEYVQTLSQLLEVAPENSAALLALASISFEKQVFGKAAALYQRYLALQPEDDSNRARYASALTFSGNLDQAVIELQTILSRNPDSFQALAYLAITYAQMGDKEQALATGTRALELAPDEEGRKRFSVFLEKLESTDDTTLKPGVSATRGTASELQSEMGAPAETNTGTTPAASEAAGVEAVLNSLRANPVAGKKFVSGALVEKTLRLTFKDFPMQAMPAFARDKFLAGITEQIRHYNLTAIELVSFVDADSGREMFSYTPR